MQYQVYGLPAAKGGTAGEVVTITAKNVAGNLELWVTGPDDPSDIDRRYNGLYYRAPSANIMSLTIRGSDDNETIIIEGPLGLVGDKTLTIEGRGGNDKVYIQGLDRPPTADKFGKITVDGGGGDDGLYIHDLFTSTNNEYHVWATEVTRLGLDPVAYSSIETLHLTAGSGMDAVFVKSGPAGTIIQIDGGPAYDKLVVGDPATDGLNKVLSKVYVTDSADLAEVVFDDSPTGTANTYQWGKSSEPGWEIQVQRAGMLQGIFVGSPINQYTLQGGSGSDLVKVDATTAFATQGNFVFGNGSNDTINVGTVLDGLKMIATKVSANGGAGSDVLVIDDKASTAAATYKISKDKIERVGGPIIFNTDSLYRQLHGAPGGNQVFVLGNSADAEAVLAINAGPDTDTVTVSNDATSTLDGILGTIAIDGMTSGVGGNDRIIFSDSGYGQVGIYTIRPDRLDVPRVSGWNLTFAGFEALEMRAGTNDDVVEVDGVTQALALTVDGGLGSDKLAILNGHIIDPSVFAIEKLHLLGGILQLDKQSLIFDEYLQNGGALQGIGTIKATQNLWWFSGKMLGTGLTVADVGSIVTISGSQKILADRTFENYGQATWTEADILGDTGTILNYGTFAGDHTYYGTFINKGQFLPHGSGTGTVTIEGLFDTTNGAVTYDLGGGIYPTDTVAVQSVVLDGFFYAQPANGFPDYTYVIVDNLGTDPVDGIFIGHPEGSTVTISGIPYRISYHDGDGNDVVLRALATVGDYAWYDKNANGVQDGGELPFAGVGVNLYSFPEHQLMGSTATDGAGHYSFTILAGEDYYLGFFSPDGEYVLTIPNVGFDESLDSDPVPDELMPYSGAGLTGLFSLEPGEIDLKWDGGFARLPMVGDYVWGDGVNVPTYFPNGIQEGSEGGVKDVVVILYTSQDVEVDRTTTGPSGYYQFTGLIPGEYYVQYILPPPPPLSGPYAFTLQYQGSDPSLDSNPNQSTGKTDLFELSLNEIENTIDAGVLVPLAVWNPEEPGGQLIVLDGASAMAMWDDGDDEPSIDRDPKGSKRSAYSMTSELPFHGVVQVQPDASAIRIAPDFFKQAFGAMPYKKTPAPWDLDLLLGVGID